MNAAGKKISFQEVAHTCNPSTQETEEEDHKFISSLDNVSETVLK